jgi:hypothetical protein
MEGASKKWIAQFSISESDVCPPDPPVFAIPSHESPESAIKAAVIKAKEAIDSEKSKNDIVLSESQTPNFQRNEPERNSLRRQGAGQAVILSPLRQAQDFPLGLRST